jgi:hypothetical protein
LVTKLRTNAKIEKMYKTPEPAAAAPAAPTEPEKK